jgi:hypothetical protein
VIRANTPRAHADTGTGFRVLDDHSSSIREIYRPIYSRQIHFGANIWAEIRKSLTVDGCQSNERKEIERLETAG